MVTLFVKHVVADYAEWRTAYDSFADTQKALGVQSEAVYQGIENPNDVTATHDFLDVETAKAFMQSTELQHAMAQAGVVGEPQIWLASEAA